MGLGSALVDRARVIRQEPAAVGRVEGSTRFVPVEGNWFRARLELPDGTEQPGPENSRRRAVIAPTLMYEDLDERDLPVGLSAQDRVEVESLEQGDTSIWDVIAEPQPIRKKSEVMGFQVTLRRTKTRQAERLV
jgi:hypothetical protein